MSHTDVAEAAIGMPQAAQERGRPVIFGNVLVFLLSLTLHTAALAALWFLAVPASGAGQGGGTDGYITVSLLGGLPGDSGGVGSGAVPANAADAAASSANESEPSDAKAHESPSVTPVQETVPAADHVTQHAEADQAKPSLPVTDAAIPVRTAKPVPKDKTPNPPANPAANPPANSAAKKSSHEQARPASAGTAQQGEKASSPGHEGGGMAAGRGGQSSGQAGQKGGGSGGENSAAGQGGSAGYLKGNYEYIKRRVRQYLVYSPQAKRMGIQGMVTVSFTIQQDGRVRDVAVSKSSGYPLLDESALEAVRSAAPFAAPPESARVIMPVQFSLR
ncbi:MAG: energy transducer TonB [Desulfovibrio sp.]|uniref:energy transducer TonB family protein n=1 Tax=Desulfovibrio sp. TaxID=885 RepID=UPI002A371AE4|nr:energy transducer TonB [Desulfovibrio sp.]MDY0259902.1 energy transducer TonB [Desulfovibrio sp.]